MIITCPNCEASFAVPDESYRPGRKARCSQCRHVFAMPALPAAAGAGAPVNVAGPLGEGASAGGGPSFEEKGFSAPAGGAVRKRRFTARQLVVAAIALFSLVALGVGGTMLYSAYKDKKAVDVVKERREARQKEAQARKDQDAQLSLITLVNVRQTVVENKRIGPLVVIEGYVRNDYDAPREFIEVEARLLDNTGKVLGSARQAAGVSLTLTQLQVLSLEELGKALNNPVDILSKNVNVLPGTQIPFLVVFSGVPEKLYSYEVRPVRAELPPPPNE